MSEPTIYEVAKELESLRRPYLVQSTDVTAYRKLLGKRYLMHVQSWGFSIENSSMLRTGKTNRIALTVGTHWLAGSVHN